MLDKDELAELIEEYIKTVPMGPSGIDDRPWNSVDMAAHLLPRIKREEQTWQQEWPDKPGAWWFYGVMKREKQRALFVVIVHATKNEPPVYIAAWQQEIMQPGELTGWFKWIPTPEMPDGAKVDVW